MNNTMKDNDSSNIKDKLVRKVEIFKALGSTVRLKILIKLNENGGRSVKEIYQKLGLCQPTVSQQLKILKMAGIVTAIRRGNRVWYQLTNHIAKEAIKLTREK